MQKLFIFLLASLLAACQVTPTPLPTPVPSAVPTHTPKPTLPPTRVPTPTASPTPSPLPPTASDYLAEGDEAYWASDLEGAERALLQAVELDPDLAPAYSHLALLYAFQPVKRERALELAAQATDLDSSDASAWAILSMVSETTYQADQALAQAQEAVDLDSEQILAHIALANAYLLQNKTGPALEALEIAEGLDAENTLLWISYASYYRHAGEFDRAVQSAEKAVELAPGYIPALLALASAHLEVQEYPEAEEQIRQALEIQPDCLAASLALADALSRQHKTDEALEAILELDDESSEIPDIFDAKGWIYYRERDLLQAIRWFQQATYRQEDFYPALLGLGMAQYEKDHCEKAVDIFNQVLEVNPYSGLGHLGLAMSLECMGETDRAGQGYVNALKYAPYDPKVLAANGRRNLSDGNTLQALEQYRASLMRSMDDMTMYNLMGKVHLRFTNDFASAESNYQQTLVISPTQQTALIGLGEANYKQAEYEKAIDTLKKAVEKVVEEDQVQNELGFDHELYGNWGKAQAQFELGASYCAIGDFTNAVTHLKQAERLKFYVPQLFLLLGRALKNLGRYEEAAEYYRIFLQVEPDSAVSQTIDELAVLLEKGKYPVTDEIVIEKIKEKTELVNELLSDQIQTTFKDIQAEQRDDQQALKMTLSVDTEKFSEEALVLSFVLNLVTGGALLPLSENTYDGGFVLVLQDQEGQVLLEASISYRACQEFSDGLVTNTIDLTDQIHVYQYWHSNAALSLDEAVENISQAVEQDRNLKAKEKVDFSFLTVDELRAYLEEEYQDLLEGENHQARDILVLLDVLDPDVDLQQALIDNETNQLEGFYDPDDKVFYIIKNNDDDDSILTSEEELTFAHEYAHALQDQYHGFSEIKAGDSLNYDQKKAFRAIVEGEASEVTRMYYANHLTTLEQMTAYQADIYAMQDVNDLVDIPPIPSFTSFPYVLGFKFIQAVTPGNYWPDIEQLYNDIPVSTEQILHPEKYKDERDDPQEVELPITPAGLGDGWTELDNNVMGEYVTRAFLYEHISPDLAVPAAAGWDGDRFAFFENESTGDDLLVWKTVWDSMEDAREYFSVHRLIFTEQNGYTETERSLHGGDRIMRWESEERSVYLVQKEDVTWQIYANQADGLDLAISALQTEWAVDRNIDK